MRTLILICIVAGIVLLVQLGSSQAASARCEVVEKEGNVLVMDCGKRAKGFSQGSKVKIKTDRDALPGRETKK